MRSMWPDHAEDAAQAAEGVNHLADQRGVAAVDAEEAPYFSMVLVHKRGTAWR